jgi:superfamily II DNA/RNA helicase
LELFPGKYRLEKPRPWSAAPRSQRRPPTRYFQLLVQHETTDEFASLGHSYCNHKGFKDGLFSETFRERYANRLPDWLLTRLEALGFSQYTPVQKVALDHFLDAPDANLNDENSRDAFIFSETGSGKTLAYLLPMLALINPARSAVQGLVIVPTAELGVQVYRAARRLAAGYTGAGTSHDVPRRDRLLVGVALNETSVDRQRRFFRDSPPRILVGVPNRVEALARMNKLKLHSVRMAVVDEVDVNLLSPEYRASLNALLNIFCISRIEGRRTTVFVSATVPQHRHFMEYARQQGWMSGTIQLLSPDDRTISEAPRTHLNSTGDAKAPVGQVPAAIIRTMQVQQRAVAADTLPEQIQHLYATCVDARKKLKALAFILEQEYPQLTQAMIFCNESRNLQQIATYIVDRKLYSEADVALLSGDMPLRQRRLALERFRAGNARLLLATEVASRGLDIPETSHVINFDLPETADQYAHRVGRTGRLGRPGRAISIIIPAERFVLERYSNRFRISFADLIATQPP